MSDNTSSSGTTMPPKKRFENSLVGFALGIAIAAIVGAFAAFGWVLREVDRQVDERLALILPEALQSDPEVKFLREQRKIIFDAHGEVAEYRSDVRAMREVSAIQLENVVAEAQAARQQALHAASTLQVRIETLNETVDASKVLAQIDARADEALQGLDDKLISRLEFPRDAVVAFAVARPKGVEANGPTDDPCPPGWHRYREANGRMIVGVGPDDNPFKNGGVRAFALKETELPSHHHGLNLAKEPHKFDQYGANFKRFAVTTGGQTNTSEFTSGPTQTHENMPPYVALYFCKKE